MGKGRLPCVSGDTGSSGITPKQKWLAGSSATASTAFASTMEGRSLNDSQTWASVSMPNLSATLGSKPDSREEAKTLDGTSSKGPGKKGTMDLKNIQKEIDEAALEEARKKKEELLAKEQARKEAEAKKENPFEVWRRTMADVNRMSLKQMHNRTDEGQVKLKSELKDEASWFKSCTMPTISNDTLFDTRVINSGHGKATQRRVEERKVKLRALMYPPSANEKRMAAMEKEQFEHFGVEIIKNGPGQLRNMNKVLRMSYERTPHGKLEQEALQEERRRKAEEERRAREANSGIDALKGMRGGGQAAPAAD